MKGEIVTLTITPAENYEIDKITVTDAAGTEIEVKDNAFTMPASEVTVTVTFKAEEKSYVSKWALFSPPRGATEACSRL